MEIDFPELKQQRKIKSMQMFKKPVQAVSPFHRYHSRAFTAVPSQPCPHSRATTVLAHAVSQRGSVGARVALHARILLEIHVHR